MINGNVDREKILNKFDRYYLANVPIRHLPLQKFSALAKEDPDVLSEFLRSTLCSRRQFPLSNRYKHTFLKALIQELEDNGLSVPDEFYEEIGHSLSAGCSTGGGPDDASQNFYQIYPIAEGRDLIIEAEEKQLKDRTTGYLVWQGAQYLVEWSRREFADKIAGSMILELGCGLGLAGIAIISLCHPLEYIMTDAHCKVVQRAKRNVEINFPPSTSPTKTNISCKDLDWTEDGPLTTGQDGHVPRYILGSDITFDPVLFPSLVQTLQRYFEAGTESAHFVHTIRDQDTLDKFRAAVQDQKGLKLVENPLSFPPDECLAYSFERFEV